MIKHEYGQGKKILSALNLTLDELEQHLGKLTDLVQIEGRNKYNVIFRLKDGIDQWKVLERLKAEGIEIDTYGSYEPSLNDIFVSCVGKEA